MTHESKEKIMSGLQAAMRAEHEGHHFYMMAASSTQDPKGKEVFIRLAKEELEHVTFLKKQFESVSSTGAPDDTIVLTLPADSGSTDPIFSDNLRGRVKDAHFEMTALSVGIHLELNASEFYAKQADNAEDTVVKEFYGVLAKWEMGHYKALLAEQESLKKDYWHENGFSPF